MRIEPAAVEELVEISHGDLRKSITILQSLACLGKEITQSDVREMSGYVPDEVVNMVMASLQTGDFAQVGKTMNELRRLGYGANQLIYQLSDLILENDILPEADKAQIFEKMSVGFRDLYPF